MSEEMIPVHPQDPMIFACTSKNPCFNSCCRDLSQALTPYDVLRLKKSLGISSQWHRAAHSGIQAQSCHGSCLSLCYGYGMFRI